MTKGGEIVPPSPIHPANPATIHCISDRERPSHSSVSSSRSSSSNSDEEHASAVGGQPDINLIGLVAAMARESIRSEDNIAGTRNIISFDESAPQSDMVQF
jgi:hypothetical protein